MAVISASPAEIGTELEYILKAMTVPQQAASATFLASSRTKLILTRFLATLDEKFQRVDSLCGRMELMMANFDQVVGSIESLKHQVPNTSVQVPETTMSARAHVPASGRYICQGRPQAALLRVDRSDPE